MIEVSIVDWPISIVPARQLFYAGGSAQDGGMTLGGANVLSPQAGGGRAMMIASFNWFGGNNTPRLLSWLMSKISNGTVFAVPIAASPQLVKAADLGIGDVGELGEPWSDNTVWDDGAEWANEPLAFTTAVSVQGSLVLTVDLSSYADVVGVGHLVGHLGRAYVIDDFSRDTSGIATITVSPPLRVPVALGDTITFRPKMYAMVQDPSAFRAMFDMGRIIQPGSVTFTEALI